MSGGVREDKSYFLIKFYKQTAKTCQYLIILGKIFSNRLFFIFNRSYAIGKISITVYTTFITYITTFKI